MTTITLSENTRDTLAALREYFEYDGWDSFLFDVGQFLDDHKDEFEAAFVDEDEVDEEEEGEEEE